jgi:dipeptidyl aminopeptidase/acylaminoacyl peptidase
VRRAKLSALVVAALIAALVLWHPARVAAQTLLLLPALFPSAPFDPLGTVTAAPTRAQYSYPYAGGTVEADLYHPASGDHHGAMLLLLGAGDLPRSDVAVHFADALARLGIVVLVPESSGMLAERLSFDEVDAVRASLDLLATQPDVDTGRVGLLGLSASGGVSIVAAAQPDLRDRIRFVNSFGSYDDTLTLLVDVASRSIDVDGQERPWQPEERTRQVVSLALTGAATDQPTTDLVSELMNDTPSRDRAQALIAQLPPATLQQLRAISPATYLAQLRAHLYLMHDVDDPFIPFTQSRDLASRAPPGVVQRYTEFSIFAHVIPERPVPWQTFVPDLWRLFWHVHAVLLEVL